MRWQGRRQSTNVNDQRGSGGFGGGMGGGLGRGGPFVVRRAGGGGIGVIIVVLIVAWFLGINPLELLSGNMSAPTQQSGRVSQPGANDEARAFVATVLADTEDTWSEIFKAAGEDYPEPTLTLFSDSVASACGYASAATGPFYCPADRNLYIDLGFFEELQSRFGAPGDFAEAYVIAHEVGHHVQNVLGILPEVNQRKQAPRRSRCECAFSPHGTAGGLFFGRVGEQHEPAAACSRQATSTKR